MLLFIAFTLPNTPLVKAIHIIETQHQGKKSIPAIAETLQITPQTFASSIFH